MAGSAKILIVEDQTAVAMIMVYLLARAGCETEVAATGKRAMQLAGAGTGRKCFPEVITRPIT